MWNLSSAWWLMFPNENRSVRVVGTLAVTLSLLLKLSSMFVTLTVFDTLFLRRLGGQERGPSVVISGVG